MTPAKTTRRGARTPSCRPSSAFCSATIPRAGAPFVVADELGAPLAADTTLLNGGSVTAGDAESYPTHTDVDGGLVGAASENLNSLRALIDATTTTYRRSTPAAARPSSADAGQPGPR